MIAVPSPWGMVTVSSKPSGCPSQPSLACAGPAARPISIRAVATATPARLKILRISWFSFRIQTCLARGGQPELGAARDPGGQQFLEGCLRHDSGAVEAGG